MGEKYPKITIQGKMQKKKIQGKKSKKISRFFSLDFSFAIFCLFLTTFGYYFVFLSTIFDFWFFENFEKSNTPFILASD